MTRTPAKWITMAIVLILAAGAWGEREREGDRRRSDRRPEGEGRSMADRNNNERERREQDERQRNEQRERQERQERQRREERERNEQRERNERREHGERDERNRDKPELRIFRFEHVPAESVIGVFHQLGERGPLREILSQIPFAVHEHSNAIVVIAPPRALEMFERIADGLDKPSDFHRRMAQQNRPAPPRQPQILRRPGAAKQPAPKRPAAAKRPGDINADAIIKAVGNPVAELLGKALSEPVARELRLDQRQRQEIRNIAVACNQRIGFTHQRVLQLIGNMPPQERAANARKVVSIARGEMGRAAGEIRKRIFSILKPEQRKLAARLLGSPGPGGKPGGCCGNCPKSKAGSKSKTPAKGKPNPKGKRVGIPAPTAAPAPGGCGGCGSRANPGIVMSDQGNCKTSDF